MLSRYFLPYDIYERHRQVGELIKKGQTIIDVGGQLNLLSQFSKPEKIIVANIKGSDEKSDVVLEKDELPFSSNSFDVVTAIDVLEHIPKSKREQFIKESLKVAKNKVILSFPIGTKDHVAYETEIENWLEKRGHEVTYLKEHIKFGLPTDGDIKKITKKRKHKLTFSGDLEVNKFLFKLFIFDPKIFLLRRLVFFTKSVFYLLTNPLLYAMLTKKNYSNKVVRAYLILYKD